MIPLSPQTSSKRKKKKLKSLEFVKVQGFFYYTNCSRQVTTKEGQKFLYFSYQSATNWKQQENKQHIINIIWMPLPHLIDLPVALVKNYFLAR